MNPSPTILGIPRTAKAEIKKNLEIKKIMTPKPAFLFPDTTVQEAATTMKALNVGFLPVGDGEKVLGVITDRDIALRVCGEGRVPTATKIRHVMTADVIYAYEDQEIGEAARIMDFYGIRRLIILSRDKAMTGILSRGDFAGWTGALSGKSLILEEAS